MTPQMPSSASEWARERAESLVYSLDCYEDGSTGDDRGDFNTIALALDAAKAEGREEAVEPRQFPMQKGPTIPWSVAEKIYTVYAAFYGTTQSLETVARRGGFSWAEVETLWTKGEKHHAAAAALRALAKEPKDD